MITIKSNESKTGWTAYVKAFKEKYGQDVLIDYKVLMQQYIKGIPV